MRDVWIFSLCALGALLGFGVLFHHADVSVAAQVITLASSIVTGAFGAAAGHAIGKATSVKTEGPVSVNNGDPGTAVPPEAK